MPGDDFDKINYVGELMVVKYIYNLIGETNKLNKLAFTKTREQTVSTNTRFKVTMGIMPDYTYSGEGVRADGVSEGKPAQKAGLQAGDIVLKIGDFTTGSMDSYMQALGKFSKGEKVKITFKRGNDIKEAEVTF
jgi:aminopeptidase YwaD